MASSGTRLFSDTATSSLHNIQFPGINELFRSPPVNPFSHMQFTPERIVEFCNSPEGIRFYKVEWQESWISEHHLMQYQNLIELFWQNQSQANCLNSDQPQRSVLTSVSLHTNKPKQIANTIPDDVIAHVPLTQSEKTLHTKPTTTQRGAPRQKRDLNLIPNVIASIVNVTTAVASSHTNTSANTDTDVQEHSLTGNENTRDVVTSSSNNGSDHMSNNNQVLSQRKGTKCRSILLNGFELLNIGNKTATEDEIKSCAQELLCFYSKRRPRSPTGTGRHLSQTCFFCEKVVSSRKILREHHLRVHFKNACAFVCHICQKRFIFQNELENHMPAHSDSRNFVCKVCGLACKRKGYLFMHMKKHEKERNTQSDDTDSKSIKSRKIIDEKPYNEKFPFPRTRSARSSENVDSNFNGTSHHPTTAIQNAFANIVNKNNTGCTGSSINLQKDEVTTISKEGGNISNKDEITEVISQEKETKCRSILLEQFELVNIANTTATEEEIKSLAQELLCFYSKRRPRSPTGNGRGIPQTCFFCQKVLANRNKLREHQLRMHFKNAGEFMCNICNVRFLYSRGLENHMITHSEKRTFICKICGLSCKQKGSLYRHMKKHENDCNYYCGVCQKNFKVQTDVKEHCLNEHASASNECNVCAQSLLTAGCLYTHSLIHSGLHEYVCQICNASFQNRRQLGIHQNRRHTKLNNVLCPACDVQFSQIKDLRNHIEQRHEDICAKFDFDYVCKICGRNMWHKTVLDEHTKGHKDKTYKPKMLIPPSTGVKLNLFQCRLCKSNFKWKTLLQAHMKKCTSVSKGAIKRKATLKAKERLCRQLQSSNDETSDIQQYQMQLETNEIQEEEDATGDCVSLSGDINIEINIESNSAEKIIKECSALI